MDLIKTKLKYVRNSLKSNLSYLNFFFNKNVSYEIVITKKKTNKIILMILRNQFLLL